MTIAIGERVPAATFLEIGASGPAEVSGPALFEGRRVALFGVPGAFTGVCSTQHVPSFIRAADAIRAAGVAEILCVAVNDPYVLMAWSGVTGARAAGIRMLSDANSEFTQAVGMAFDNPAQGFHQRSKRYAMMVDNGVVKVLNIEANRGACEISSGETLLAAL